MTAAMTKVCGAEEAKDGKIFDSVYEVAYYLGLAPLPSLGGPLSKKRKLTRTTAANGSMEKRGTLMNSNCKDPPSDGLNVECASARGNIPKLSEIGGKEDCHSHPQQSAVSESNSYNHISLFFL